MDNFFETFILTFVPIFIVIDALGTVPFISSMTAEATSRERRRIVNVSILTAIIVGLAFLFLGSFILEVLDISVGAFAIGGGIILLVFAIRYMTTGHMVELIEQEMVAIVPIGTPLLAGPATIVTLLLLDAQYPIYMVLLAYVLNIGIAWLVFIVGDKIISFMGIGGINAFSRVMSLLLAALAVNMVIQGLDMLGILSITS